MNYRLSVIIPNRNGADTVGLCLEALFRSEHDSFEVIVVDDASIDNSVEIIEKFPCRLVRLENHAGASAARNIGAQYGRGALLFFIDADCLVYEDTLCRAEKAAEKLGENAVIGGTYTRSPYDQTFYSTFQSVFIHYSELKNIRHPDYIAAHAMVIASEAFRRSGGFPVDFFPIIEDVEFSHRLRRKGYHLVMMPELQVRHIFGFRSMADSIRNGYVKSRYWTMYSLANRDLLADSGTASVELKVNVLSLFGSLALAALYLLCPSEVLALLLMVLVLFNLFVNRNLFALFHRTGAKVFLLAASMYYMFVYPFAVGAGALVGTFQFVTPSGMLKGKKI